MVSTVTGQPGQAEPATASLNGVEEFDRQLSDQIISLSGTGVDNSGPGETRTIGPDMYEKIPGGIPSGLGVSSTTKPWVHLKMQAFSGAPAGLSGLFGSGGSDPAAFVKLLTDASSSVTTVGTDVVRGQPSTHYRLTLDAAKMAKLDASEGECDDESASPANMPVDVWLDAQGRLTRMRTDDTAPEPAGVPGATPSNGVDGVTVPVRMTMSIEFYDFGTPVIVTRPPIDQTQEFSSLLGGQDPFVTDDPTPSASPTACSPD